jgi:DNA-binding transcriptional LysR family regulator
MELVALRTFQTVVDEGGILAASRKLNTVQSNVTSRIQRLEEELGAELFFRKGRGLELAPSGRVLLDYARRILQLERQTSAAIRSVGENAGELRIGTMETFAALHLPRALKTVRAQHPGLKLHICTDTSAALLDQVIKHKLDCAFIGGPVSHADLGFKPLIVEELVQTSAKNTDTTEQPLILFREGCAYRARALAWQRSLGYTHTNVMEFGTLEGILGCVAVGLGWTLMPRRVIEQSMYADELCIKPLPEHISHVPTGMVYLKDAPRLMALNTLCDAAMCLME